MNSPAQAPLVALVVDDNVDNARTLAQILTMLGCRTMEAFDGSRALDAAQGDPPDVAFVDLNMPGLDGHQVAEGLRRIKQGEPACIVCITGRLLQRDEMAAITADGFDRVLFKPIELSEIESVLSSCTASRRGPSAPASGR